MISFLRSKIKGGPATMKQNNRVKPSNMISFIYKKHYFFMFSLVFAFCVFFLYFISPPDNSVSIPSPFASRYLWTPFIPIFICLSIMSMTLGEFMSKLEKIDKILCINLIFFMVLLSPQFAELSPIGEDGWWFVSIAERYSEYGSDNTEGYLSKMISLIPLDIMGKIFQGSIPKFASIGGILLSIIWISTIASSTTNSLGENSWTIPAFTLICLLMVTWYNPLQYSAQMFSLCMAAYAIHNIKTINKYLFFFLLIITPATHLQSSIILGSILVTESFIRNHNSDIARQGSLVLGTSFICWNLTISKTSFLKQFPESIDNFISIPILIIPVLIVLFVSKLLELRYGFRESKTDPNEIGVSHTSIIIGCLLVLPMMYFIDLRMDAARLVPRLLVYAVVPFSYWLATILQTCFSFVVKNRLKQEKVIFMFAFMAIFSGILSGVAHTNYSSRTMMMPAETSECWEMAENSGLVGLVEPNSRQINLILHTHAMIAPSDAYNYQWFIRMGDEEDFSDEKWLSLQSNTSGTYFSAILETADLDDNDMLRSGISPDIYESWYLAGEVKGACRFWVDTNDIHLLNPNLYWDKS